MEALEIRLAAIEAALRIVCSRLDAIDPNWTANAIDRGRYETEVVFASRNDIVANPHSSRLLQSFEQQLRELLDV